MKYVSCSVIFLILGLSCAEGINMPKNMKRLVNLSCDSSNFETRCTDDCTGIIECIAGHQYIMDCKKNSENKKPFCNSELKQCDSSMDHCIADSRKVCYLGEGFYPNLLNCAIFYYCENKDGMPVQYECDEGTVYNPKNGLCEMNLTCYTFSPSTYCKDQSGKFIPHPLNKTFIIECTDTVPHLLMCNCQYEFNPTTAACDFVCRKDGRFKDCFDKYSYYTCVKSETSFIRTHHKCPDGLEFDEGKGICIHGDSHTTTDEPISTETDSSSTATTPNTWSSTRETDYSETTYYMI